MIAFRFSILQEHATKPKFGEPCNNCGLCCRVQQCAVSLEVFGPVGSPCHALELHDGKFLCGIALRPEHYLSQMGQPERDAFMAEARRELSLGWGCGMDDAVVAVKL